MTNNRLNRNKRNNRILGISLVAAVPLSLIYWQIAPNDFINPAWLQILYGYVMGFSLTLMFASLFRGYPRLGDDSAQKSETSP